MTGAAFSSTAQPAGGARLRLLACALALLTAGCGPADPGAGGSPGAAPTGPGGGSREPAPVSPAEVGFSPCAREQADPTSTHLQAGSVPAEETDDALSPVAAQVVLEDAGELLLPAGAVSTGSGYEVAAGIAGKRVEVADGPTTARVSMAVYEGDRTGRRVAFVEARLPGDEPVRWQEADAAIVTDGGDGGFLASGAQEVDDVGGELVAPYVDAFFPGGDSTSGHVCVHRIVGGQTDAVLFSTGFGDGWYPVYVGVDAAGRTVSVVQHGGIVPWSRSGLPGEPPPFR